MGAPRAMGVDVGTTRERERDRLDHSLHQRICCQCAQRRSASCQCLSLRVGAKVGILAIDWFERSGRGGRWVEQEGNRSMNCMKGKTTALSLFARYMIVLHDTLHESIGFLSVKVTRSEDCGRVRKKLRVQRLSLTGLSLFEYIRG